MYALAVELPIRLITISTEAAVATTGAGLLLGNEPDGFAISAKDDSMEIRSSTVPALNYAGSAITKFGACRASAGMYYDSAGIIQSSANSLRIDYSPRNAGVPGYLVEETRTNELTYSETFAVVYTQGSLAFTVNSSTAPSGLLTAGKFYETATTVEERNFYVPITATAATYVFSIYLKAAGRDWAFVRFDPGGPVYGAYFNLVSGTVGTVSGVTATIQAVGDGWFRCTVSRLVTAGTWYCSVELAYANGVIAYAGVVNSGIYAWGRQCELGSSATSYIPTTAAAVTRAADLPYILTSILPFHTSVGSQYVWTVSHADTQGIVLIFLGADLVTQSNLGAANYGGTGQQSMFEIWEAGTLMVRTFGGSAPRSTPHKLASAWSPTNNNAAFDGATPDPDDEAGAASLPTVDRFQFGYGPFDVNHFNGWIMESLYVPRRMTNAELQTLTSAG
jgi:hypothetical protein